MRRENVVSTDQLPRDFRSHDMRKMLRHLRVPGDVATLPSCRIASNKSGTPVTIDFSELHQAWRYGKKLDEATERQALSALEKILEWTKGEIS